jgi:predicted metalloprotease with PDZ domain
MAFSLQHSLRIADVRAHLVSVETTARSDEPLAGPLVFFMPVWTPGSYLVREYARHVERLVGFADGAPCAATKIRKNAWSVGREGAREVTLRYFVYANELTVRTNHVDETHALLNGAGVFVAIEGHQAVPSTVEVFLPPGWSVMTALPRDGTSPATPERGPHKDATSEGGGRARFVAQDFDTLVDSPMVLGDFRSARVEVRGVAHDVAIWPRDQVDEAQVAKLLADFAKIVQTESEWFGGTLPYDRYSVLLHVYPRGRGGLEHMSSAALVANPSAFATRESYLDLLSLVSHELFHAWNVKRIRPGGLFPYRYEEENYTRLLWWFEGATSYYDWRTLRVAGLCTVDEYTDHLAGEIAAMGRVPGRFVQSLEQASFDAWIKLYRPDENSENSSVSYYRKGEIVCALLDMEIRARSHGKASLDDVLAYLWKNYGAVGRPVPEGSMQALMEEATGVSLGDLFDAWIRTPGELDYDRTRARVGLRLERESPPGQESIENKAVRPALGLRARSEANRVVVATVARGGPAQMAGIDPGDELVAVSGRRIEVGSLDAALAAFAPGQKVGVTVARDGRVLSLEATLEQARPEKIRIVPRAEATPAERAMGAAWQSLPALP